MNDHSIIVWEPHRFEKCIVYNDDLSKAMTWFLLFLLRTARVASSTDSRGAGNRLVPPLLQGLSNRSQDHPLWA